MNRLGSGSTAILDLVFAILISITVMVNTETMLERTRFSTPSGHFAARLGYGRSRGVLAELEEEKKLIVIFKTFNML